MTSPVLLCACVFAVCAAACTPASKTDKADKPGQPASEIGLTVIRRAQSDSVSISADTVVRGARIDCAMCPVDLYFCRDSLGVPLILPSGGFAHNQAQEKECNWDIYPATVRCCSYDSAGNVVSMSINSSGTTQEWKYAYDATGRVVECKGWWSLHSVQYDNAGRIARLTTQKNSAREDFDFVYAQ